MKLSEMTDKGLVEACIKADQELKVKKSELDSYKAELQKRGNDYIENQNIKYVKFYSCSGSVSVMDSQKLEALNVDCLKELLGEGLFKQDKRSMLIILGYMTKDDNEDQIEAPDLDTELWFIYRIKNTELIQAYFPEKDLEKTIEEIRKCILVDTSTAITVEYDKEDK